MQSYNFEGFLFLLERQILPSFYASYSILKMLSADVVISALATFLFDRFAVCQRMSSSCLMQESILVVVHLFQTTFTSFIQTFEKIIINYRPI